MKRLISVILILAVAGCATCKSSDTAEQCRTKQRNKSQKSSSLLVIPARDSGLAASADLSIGRCLA
jgi:hypothetical protein